MQRREARAALRSTRAETVRLLRKLENEDFGTVLTGARVERLLVGAYECGGEASFRKYVTLKDADKMSAAALRPIWEKLRSEVRAWPDDGNFSVAAIEAMVPACRAADAIRGTVKVADVVETRYWRQALKEIG